MADYELTINLMDKTSNFPITVLEDLKPFFAKLDATHTGVQKTNNALLTLYIPPNGKFIRSFPLLMEEQTKVLYMIEIQINQAPNEGHKFRCEIGQPTAKSDKDLGEILEIPLVCQEFVTKEHFDSFQELFVAPNSHFLSIINNYNKTAGATGVVLNVNTPADLDLPNEDALKQNWLPLSPTRTGNLMEEVINRLALEPTVGGVLTDFYYDFLPNVSTLRIQDVIAEEFGEKDSGVVISPLTVGQVGAESGNTFNLDNLIFKNLVILKADPNCGSLPREHQVFTSEYLHALQRPLWNVGETYETGDVVQVVVAGFPEQRFFTSLVDSNLGNNPLSSPGQWVEDFSIDPSSPAFFTPTPWTSDFDNQEANVLGKNNLPVGGYEGYMADYNITRFNFDREVPNNNFERVSVKMVDFRLNGPPTSVSLWENKRYICGIEGSDDGDMVGVFVGHRGEIAEFTGDPLNGLTHVWHFSDPPIDTGSGSTRQQDSVNYLPDATVLVWDDSANGGNGDWIEQWNVNELGGPGVPADAGKSAGSPFHPVKEYGLVTGATGIPDQAIEARYDWKTDGAGLGILTDPVNGNIRNLASRGAWLSFLFPYPRVPTGSGPIGNAFGLDRQFPFLDTFNLTRTSDGQIGWNLPNRAAEDLGSISSITFKLKLGQFRSTDDSELINGFANEPMVFWAIDRADRVFVQDFTQRVNNAWEQHTIPVGPRAPQSLYNSRINELEIVFGHILPNFNFFLPEREFSGVLFDWRYLKGFGVFMKTQYDDQGLYSAVYDQWFANSIEALEQALHKAGQYIQNAIQGIPQEPSLNFITDHTKIALDELHFDKELYVTSSDTQLSNPRVTLERDETQDDYLDARAKAEAIDARKEFFPQFWFITARGDVRLKLGQKFVLDGPRVPNAPLELVCSQVKHRIDTDGYYMEIFGVRKFEFNP